MRWLLLLGIPLLFQLTGFGIVLVASSGHGSFVGLGAMLLGIFVVPLLIVLGVLAARSRRPWPGPMLALLLFGTLPPLGLLVLEFVVR